MAARINYPQTIIDEVRKLFEQGLGKRTIAAKVGIKRGGVTRIYKDLGLDSAHLENSKKEYPKETIQQVKEMFDKGMGQRAIAKELNLKRRDIKRIYVLLNIDANGRHMLKTTHLVKKKICRNCQKLLSIDEFRKLRTATGHLSFEADCFDCAALKRKEEYHKDVEASRKKSRENKNPAYREVINARSREKWANDPSYRLRAMVSAQINRSLKKEGSSKMDESCMKYLTFTISELRSHLENLFEDWMNWDNHGNYRFDIWDDNDSSTWTWQLDHIIPQSTLPYSSMEHENFKKCWALENLRPYSAKQNVIDGNRREPLTKESANEPLEPINEFQTWVGIARHTDA